MRKGFYMWDWYGSKQIVYDPELDMGNEVYANSQDCFKRFDDCKKRAIQDLEWRIRELLDTLDEVKALTRSKVESV